MTQLVDKATMYQQDFCSVGAISWVTHRVCEGDAINDCNDRLRDYAKVYYLAVGEDARNQDNFDVLETFTVWKEYQFQDEQGYFIAIRMTNGLITPAEACTAGHQVHDDCDPVEVAARLYWEVLRHMYIFRKPPVGWERFEIFRVTKPMIGPKWEWSDWNI